MGSLTRSGHPNRCELVTSKTATVGQTSAIIAFLRNCVGGGLSIIVGPKDWERANAVLNLP